MKQIVALTKTAELVILTPLYAAYVDGDMGIMLDGYTLSLMKLDQRLAYVVDAGDKLNKSVFNGNPRVFGERFVEEHFIFLGDL